MPILSDQCSSGPFDVNFTITATISIGMQRILSKIADATMSKMRLLFTICIHQGQKNFSSIFQLKTHNSKLKTIIRILSFQLTHLLYLLNCFLRYLKNRFPVL